MTDLHAAVTFRLRLPPALVKAVVTPVANRIFAQDRAILRAQADNVRRFGGEQFASTELDVLGQHILRLLRRAERGEPTPTAPTAAAPPTAASRCGSDAARRRAVRTSRPLGRCDIRAEWSMEPSAPDGLRPPGGSWRPTILAHPVVGEAPGPHGPHQHRQLGDGAHVAGGDDEAVPVAAEGGAVLPADVDHVLEVADDGRRPSSRPGSPSGT